MLRSLRTWFFAGLAIIVPLALTVIAFKWMYDFLDGWVHPVLRSLGLPDPPGLGAVITVLLTLLAGFIASFLLGRQMVDWGQNMLLRVPLVRNIYGTAKQLSDAMFFADKAAFQAVCIIEWPRPGCYTLGFVTGHHRDAAGNSLVALFVPPAFTLMGGWVMLLPEHDVKIIEMSVEEGLKVSLSGGVYTSNSERQAAVVAAAAKLKAQRGGDVR